MNYEAWQKRYNYIQIDKNKDLDDMFSIKNVSRLEIATVPEKCFLNYQNLNIFFRLLSSGCNFILL